MRLEHRRPRLQRGLLQNALQSILAQVGRGPRSGIRQMKNIGKHFGLPVYTELWTREFILGEGLF